MAINKVVMNNDDGTQNVLVDLTGDNVSADKILSGYKAHDKSGNQIVGNVSFKTVYTGSTEPATNLGINGDLYLKLV